MTGGSSTPPLDSKARGGGGGGGERCLASNQDKCPSSTFAIGLSNTDSQDDSETGQRTKSNDQAVEGILGFHQRLDTRLSQRGPIEFDTLTA